MPRVTLAPMRESSRLCVLAARRLHVEKLKMSGRERTLVTVMVGHTSEMFPELDANGHRFRWTCFVRPIAPHKFTDRSFISKVKFTLHSSYKTPVRTVRQPPFEVTETGYGSFPPQIEITFNYPGAKPMKYTYDMLITLDPTGFTQQAVVFELKDCPPSFVELAKKYGAKRKRSAEIKNEKDTLFPPLKIQKLEDDRSSRESSKAPKEKKKDKEKQEKSIGKEKKKKKEKKDKKEASEKTEKKREKTKSPAEQDKKSNLDAVKASGSGQASPRLPVTPQRPLKLAPNKTDERKPPVDSDSSSPSTSYGSLTPPPSLQLSSIEMQKRITALSDEDQIFRVATLLLSHPGSSIFPSKGVLSFDLDLSTADPSLVARLNEALAS